MLVPILLMCVATFEALKQKNDVHDKFVDKEDKEFQRPVDFLHVYREGYGDRDYKQPLHLLEFDMVKPKNKEHADELFNRTKLQNIQWIPKDESLIFNSPRDEILYYKRRKERYPNKTAAGDIGRVYDFLNILERNLEQPLINTRQVNNENKIKSEPKNKYKFVPNLTISNVFDESGFYMKPNANNRINWTTCDEFSLKALFHAPDIVNVQWLPFYIWSKRGFSTAVIHIFSYPTKKLVNYYKTSFGSYVRDIDWSRPKLILKERREILLISSNEKGLFYGIPDREPPKREQGNFTLPTIKMRLKIRSPYVALMYCDESYAILMAERGTEPESRDDKIKEALKLKFRGTGKPVYRDIESEKLFSHLAQLRKSDEENRKIIKINRIVGDVDYAVRH